MKRRPSLSLGENLSKRFRHASDDELEETLNLTEREQDIIDLLEEAFNIIESEHENIELLLYRRRILHEMSVNDPLYVQALGDWKTQMLATGQSINFGFSLNASDRDTLNRMNSLLDTLMDQLIIDTGMIELRDVEIERIAAIERYHDRLKQEVTQLIGEIVARENAERNYLEWLDNATGNFR
ncbi:hypothetical protein HA402_011852 [Bradysia odoriphaga]|nr:hypothetical protein HA402_011852 [Bradysia odoriphaga]